MEEQTKRVTEDCRRQEHWGCHGNLCECECHLNPSKELREEVMREFASGATRDLDSSKLDYEGFLSPLVLEAYAEYMNVHRKTASGIRASDNWQKGIPLDVYMKSMWRHFMEVWKHQRKLKTAENLKYALCALMFNVMGYLHEHLKEEGKQPITYSINPEDLCERCKSPHTLVCTNPKCMCICKVPK